ncbi:MAG: GNAT family N-acetyltransferase [Hyphomicrobiaceae bacterium]|nr:GNAT family N-acetyltransferase [Hyphomicrobiaceae bacterium]
MENGLALSHVPAARFHASLDEVPSGAWDELFPGSPEDWAFYRAIEDSPPEGFRLGALTVPDEAGRLLAAVPVFKLDYRLDTPFQGRLRRIADWVDARRPGLSSVGVVGLGSPLSDSCSLGFAQSTPAASRAEAFAAMLGWLEAEANSDKSAIMAVKSLGEPEASAHRSVLEAAGYGEIRSVPVVVMEVAAASLDDYLKGLKRQHRSYFRNKLKTLDRIRVEHRPTAAGLEAELVRLYEATLSQSGVSYGEFDRIGTDYFRAFLDRQGARAQLMLFWQGDKLVSFHLFHVGSRRIISNKMGMSYPEARELNLYFINWLKIIEFACARGIREIEMGATTYAAKLLFGGHLERRYVHFRFRRPRLNRLSRPFHRFFDFERNDEELRKLAAERPLPYGSAERMPPP